jgi:hypothetical protein
MANRAQLILQLDKFAGSPLPFARLDILYVQLGLGHDAKVIEGENAGNTRIVNGRIDTRVRVT